MPNRDNFPAGHVGWIDVATVDVEGAKEFYGQLFGWSFEDMPGPDGELMYSMASLNGRLVAGMAAMTQETADQMGMGAVWNVYFFADSVDSAHKAAKAAGGSTFMEPMDIMDSGRMTFMHDNQGAGFGIWEPKEHKGMGVVGEHGAHCWTELVAADLDKAVDFYRSVFGYNFSDAPVAEGYPAYKMLMLGEQMVGGMMTPPMPGIPNCWGIYFGSTDAQSIAARVRELGGTVIREPFPTPGGDVSVFQDPQGGIFNTVQMSEWPTE